MQLKILLTGKNGQVGWELQRTLAPLGELIALDRSGLDLSKDEQVRDCISDIRPNLIVNAAAYTAVDRAESESELATQINATAPGIMAEAAKRVGAVMVHYSTDYVFDGTKREPYTEEDAPNPQNVYGRTKLAGEQAIQASGARYFIFRTSWVYGARGKNFLLTILRLAQERNELRIVDDQFGAPTWSRTIAEVTASVLLQADSDKAQPISGIFNLAANGATTWCRFAQAAAKKAGLLCRMTPISTAEYAAVATRPANSTLATAKLTSSFDTTLPSWEEALDDVLSELRAESQIPSHQ
jgi:dTDP-4-dehydrorhamnose reductase